MSLISKFTSTAYLRNLPDIYICPSCTERTGLSTASECFSNQASVLLWLWSLVYSTMYYRYWFLLYVHGLCIVLYTRRVVLHSTRMFFYEPSNACEYARLEWVNSAWAFDAAPTLGCYIECLVYTKVTSRRMLSFTKP